MKWRRKDEGSTTGPMRCKVQHVLLDSCFPVQVSTLSPFLILRPGARSNNNNYLQCDTREVNPTRYKTRQSFIETRGLFMYEGHALRRERKTKGNRLSHELLLYQYTLHVWLFNDLRNSHERILGWCVFFTANLLFLSADVRNARRKRRDSGRLKGESRVNRDQVIRPSHGRRGFWFHKTKR